MHGNEEERLHSIGTLFNFQLGQLVSAADLPKTGNEKGEYRLTEEKL